MDGVDIVDEVCATTVQYQYENDVGSDRREGLTYHRVRKSEPRVVVRFNLT